MLRLPAMINLHTMSLLVVCPLGVEFFNHFLTVRASCVESFLVSHLCDVEQFYLFLTTLTVRSQLDGVPARPPVLLITNLSAIYSSYTGSVCTRQAPILHVGTLCGFAQVVEFVIGHVAVFMVDLKRLVTFSSFNSPYNFVYEPSYAKQPYYSVPSFIMRSTCNVSGFSHDTTTTTTYENAPPEAARACLVVVEEVGQCKPVPLHTLSILIGSRKPYGSAKPGFIAAMRFSSDVKSADRLGVNDPAGRAFRTVTGVDSRSPPGR